MAAIPCLRVVPLVSALLLVLCSVCYAGTAKISSYPLAVRNPYLSAWLPGNESTNAPTAAPQFWQGQTLTWPVLARVGGKTYTLFGAPNGVSNATPATQNSISFTSTHTVIQLTAGAAKIELDFFSPVSPNNYVRHSMPYSYLTVTASASNVAVQVLSAIDNTWTGATGALQSSYQTSGGAQYFNISSPSATLFVEKNQQAAWGSAVWATEPVSGSQVTYQAGTPGAVETAFTSNGKLANSAAAYAAGNLYAFAHDLGTVGSGGKSARFAVGYDTKNAVNFFGQSYTQYYRSQYPNVGTAAAHFLSDYGSAYSESQTFDQKVVSKGAAFSTAYTDLLEASVRQIYGAMEVGIPLSSMDTSNPLIFLKEISSNGDASTVDVIYPSYMALYLLSPQWLELLLKPYLIYLNTNGWPKQYIPHDLGTFPNYVGHNDGNDEPVIVEATASFFIMLQSHLKATGASNAWLQPYVGKLTTAADYLVNNGLYPASQLSTVDAIPATANQTGLAISAAVGLKAIGAALGMANYTQAGDSFAGKIYPKLGTNATGSPRHFTFNYGLPQSWVTTFHLTPDLLLGLDTFPVAASQMQADWYKSLYLPNGDVAYSYNVDFTISEWIMWAGAASDKVRKGDGVQEMAINMVHQFITNGLNNVPFPTKFNVQGSGIGLYIQNKARPTVGSMWAPMALNGNWNS